MKKRDKNIADAIKKTFAPQPQKEELLYTKISSKIFVRRTYSTYLLIGYLSALFCTVIYFVIKWEDIKNIDFLSYNMIFDAIRLQNNEAVIQTTVIISLVVTIIWYVYNMLEEFYSLENSNIIEQAMKNKREKPQET